MKPKVRYLLQCYMNNGDSPEADDQERPLLTTDITERSGLLESHSGNEILPDDILGYIQPNPIQHRNLPNAQLDLEARQRIRILAGNLNLMAAQFNIGRLKSLLSVERAILHNEGLSPEEMNVVDRIHATGSHSSISVVANCLDYCLTSRTFKAALRFLCYSATSVSQELAFACELSSLVMPRIRQLDRSNSVYSAITDFIENKLESVLDM